MSEMRKALEEWAETHEEELVFFEGLDGAIIGLAQRNSMNPVVAYDRAKCVEIFAKSFGYEKTGDPDKPDYEAAEEWMCFNVDCMWAGEATPVMVIPTMHFLGL